jgi:predicted nucleotidyltransferase
MGVFGFREAYDITLLVKLPGDESIRVVSLAALSVLKLVAWEERRWHRPGADAQDIAVILRRYLDAGNHERLYTEAEHLLNASNFDFEAAGAWLLGHDMARLLPTAARPRIGGLLERESDPEGAIDLIGDLPIEPERSLRLLQSLARGFRESGG